MPTARDVADRYFDERCALDPTSAILLGASPLGGALTGYSPEHREAMESLRVRTLAELSAADVADPADTVCAGLLEERLRAAGEMSAAGEDLRALGPIGSPLAATRQAFDLLMTDTPEQQEAFAATLESLPAALDAHLASLRLGLARGIVAPRRQVEKRIANCQAWASGPGSLSARIDGVQMEGRMAVRMAEAAGAADAAWARTAAYLRDSYAPRAITEDAVGEELHRLHTQMYLGADLDPRESYAWGWEELARILETMDQVADRIIPGAGRLEVAGWLDSDPAQAVQGVDELQRWLQELTDEAIAKLDGTVVDIAPPLRACECCIAPPGGGAAMYYTPPAMDFSRPGRTWYPTQGQTTFPKWGEVSTCYHEGVPGHHMQLGQTRVAPLSRWQKTLFISGHGEGWALYAERLMGELGYLEEPAHELGMLAMHAFRAARVVVDIGLHLKLQVPAGTFLGHAGETWTPELAVEILDKVGGHSHDFIVDEVDRYLGWPAQATAYKLGEREWLAAREAARQSLGSAFDLKDFHMRALNMGALGLDQLRRELERVTASG